MFTMYMSVLKKERMGLSKLRKPGDIENTKKKKKKKTLVFMFFTLIFGDNFFMSPKELWEAYSNRTVRPSVRPASCPVHNSHIL